MLKKEILLLALIAAIFIFPCPSLAQQTFQSTPAPAPLPQQQTIQQPTKISSFSADLIMLNPNGVVEQQAKIYITPSKIRVDKVFPTSGPRIAMIFRRDRNVRWMLNSANKTYLMQPLNEVEIGTFIREHITARSEKTLGTQTVSGFTCSIKTVEATASFSGSTRKIPSTIWVSPRLDIPIRTRSQDGSITELRNIQAGPPPEGLFELPGGYVQVSKVMELRGIK